MHVAPIPGSGSRPQGQDRLIRTFVCIELPGEVQDRIDTLQSRLKAAKADVSWVRPNMIHLTLKFLGEVPASRIGSICSSVERTIQNVRSFSIEVGGTGCFPSLRNPRVLWIGIVSPAVELNRLQASIASDLESSGFRKEERPFSPHLTLGRVRSQFNARKLGDELIQLGFEKVSFEVLRIVVMRSDLKARGAVHTPLATLTLPTTGLHV